MSAVEEAYKSISETRTFPVCALYVKVDESKVDINVHPQKMEIKFSDERKIYSSVYYAIKNALNNYDSLNNDFVFTETKHIVNGFATNPAPTINIKDEKEENNTNDNYTSKYFDLSNKPRTQTPLPPFQKAAIIGSDVPDIPHFDKKHGEPKKIYSFIKPEQIDENTKIVNNINNNDKYNYKIIGEAFYGYIFVEKDEKIIIIDKHAAHERIIYDIILKKAADDNLNSEFKSQILLVPVEVKLTPKETAGILDIEKDMKKLGIILEWKDDETVYITEVPAEIFDANIEETIREAAYLSSEGNLSAHETAFEKLVMLSAKKSAACRAAMKSGISDSVENIAWLVDRVMNYEDVKYCPHGRPVAFEITKYEIEKQFKR
jgi:DNA mismatch repair protein MutL